MMYEVVYRLIERYPSEWDKWLVGTFRIVFNEPEVPLHEVDLRDKIYKSIEVLGFKKQDFDVQILAIGRLIKKSQKKWYDFGDICP